MVTPAAPQVSIVIVTWNVRKLLETNLSRLFALDSAVEGVSFEVLVVDNGSHDGTRYMVRRDFPQVKLICNDWDAGFAGPNDQALRLANGEVCILLNPDMLVEPGAIGGAYRKLMEDKTIGVLGIRLTKADGVTPINSVRRLPDVWSQLAILLKLNHLFPQLISKYMWDDFDYSKSQDVDQVRGSFFAFRRDTMEKVGVLDPDYHIWFEEVDYCRRVAAAGLRVRYEAELTAHDYVGRGFALMRHLEKQIIFGGSMVHYFRKWGTWWQKWLLTLARPVGILGAWLADVWDDIRNPRRVI